MKDILVLGVGEIGRTSSDLLAETGDHVVTIDDRTPAQLDWLNSRRSVARLAIDVADRSALDGALKGRFDVHNGVPFHLAVDIAEAARHAGAYFLDLTQDVAGTQRIKALAAGAQPASMPQYGLASGFISIVAYDLAHRFETLDTVRMRVGALPRFPSNALNYNLI